MSQHKAVAAHSRCRRAGVEVSGAVSNVDSMLDQVSRQHPGGSVQLDIDALGRPLSDVTFCVVDLETTGGSATADRITEIGAVKVRSGDVLGEFQTLVNPARPIPGMITVLTGITESMVAQSPQIDSVLPAFLEFARGSVLVAHNAPFDVGFLKQAAADLGRPWPGFEVLDTVKLARHVVTKDESPNHKLASLARVFNSSVTPNHRALDDARATVEVLHGLIGRLGSLGVQSLEELQSYSAKTSTTRRRSRHLGAHLPLSLGVCMFLDGNRKLL